jgi:hypothetical protein
MATGRWDLEVDARAWWARQFGSTLTPEQVTAMHPLRRLQVVRPRAGQPEPMTAGEVETFDQLTGG